MSTRSIEKTRSLRKLELGVAIFLTLLLAGFIVLSVRYPPRARLFPLLVAVPSFVCMVLLTSSHFSERVEKLVAAFNTALFESDAEMLEGDTTELEEEGIRRSLGWLVGALVAFYLFGFVLMTFVFIYAYMTIEGDHSRRESGIIAIVTGTVMYLLFVVVFGVRLDGGAIFNFFFDLMGI